MVLLNRKSAFFVLMKMLHLTVEKELTLLLVVVRSIIYSAWSESVNNEKYRAKEWKREREYAGKLKTFRMSAAIYFFICHVVASRTTINALCIKWCLCVRASSSIFRTLARERESISLGMTYNKGGNRIQSAHYLYYTFSLQTPTYIQKTKSE